MSTAAERKTIYSRIEAETGNPLIVYATSRRPNASGTIAADAVDEFIRQVDLIEGNPDTIDVLIESNGGDGLVVWRLVSILRSKAKRVRALVPHSAFSASTLFCLGSDEIVMGKYANLGPTDPQITTVGKDGSVKNFAFEDVVAFIRLVKKEFGLWGRNPKDILNHLFDSMEPFSLGFASRSSALSQSMGVKLLQSRSDNAISRIQANAISGKLNKSFFNHSHPLNKSEAKEIGLNVTDPSDILADLMWEAHLAFDDEFLNKKPFEVLCNYLENNPPLALGGATLPIGEYEFELKFVVVESSRFLNDFYVKYRTTVYRDQQALYNNANVAIAQGWRQ